ncbi:MAG: carboxyl transferase [Firmicutes bacterium HGW-Firmicutes-1]|jgi:acetyl-CoA carboxylase carboxyltransferase component|nr:MAG: carboxyl transferase [Firmicutes bacterium HGW-Firmicutes-1]
MSIQEKISELTNRRGQIEQGGGSAAIEKIHADGKLTARERVELLLDTNTFVELGAFVKQRATDFNLSVKEAPADGVVTGYGAINGRLVYVYSQDATVMGGALGEMHAKKITTIYDMALKMGAPVLALIDSAGLRLQEATDALEGFGILFLKQSLASGVVPQITAILGSCGGGAAVIPSLSDFTFMTEKNTKLFVNSPNALDDKSASFEKYASAAFHAENTGIVDFVCESDAACLASMRNLVDLLPSNNYEESPLFETTDDPNRITEELALLANIVEHGVNARTIITSIADNNAAIEVKANYATEVVTSFVKLNGSTVGIVANHTIGNEGKITSIGCKKIVSFVKFCDAFNIPLVTFTDVAGFAATVAEERAGLSKAVAKMTYSFASATVPKINVIVNRAYGSAYVSQNSKHIGADFVFAWPTAVISVMDATAAVKIMYAEEIATSSVSDEVIAAKSSEYANLQASPYVAASRGYIDDVIDPASTRKRLIAALEMLFTKRDFGPEKKHGTV